MAKVAKKRTKSRFLIPCRRLMSDFRVFCIEYN